MRQLRISNAAMMQIAVQREISRSEEARYDHRLHGILLTSRGLSCYEVAGLLGEDPRTIERWVRRLETKGLRGLREGKRPGRPRRLSAAQWDAVYRDLQKRPRDFGYPQNLWSGRLLAHHLETVHKVALGARQCQRLFQQIGFRARKSGPIMADAEPAGPGAHKKTPRSRPQPRR